jgi:hypothetical protein
MYTIPPGQNGCPTTDEIRRDAPQNAGTLAADIEAAIVDCATQAPAPGETHHACSVRRENELAEIFDQLTAVEALALGRRLDRDRDDDPIAVAMRRVAPDRWRRLRAYLSDVRRRTSRRTTARSKEE